MFGVQHDALTSLGDAGSAQIQRPVGVFVEDDQVVMGGVAHANQVAHGQGGSRAYRAVEGLTAPGARVADALAGLVSYLVGPWATDALGGGGGWCPDVSPRR